jgi:hypothetical protein
MPEPRENLEELGIELASSPRHQYNNGISGHSELEAMRRELNLYGVPDFEAVALNGVGVFETRIAAHGPVKEKLSK